MHGGRDTSRFEDRFGALATLSYKVAYRLTGDRGVAEDLCQEALARAYSSWRRVAGYDEAWVARVTTNLAIGRWRKDRRLVSGERHDLRPVADPVDPAVRVELVAALRALPRRQREVVALRYLADLPEAAVAAALGCSTGSVKQHAHRGLAALRTPARSPRRPPVHRPRGGTSCSSSSMIRDRPRSTGRSVAASSAAPTSAAAGGWAAGPVAVAATVAAGAVGLYAPAAWRAARRPAGRGGGHGAGRGRASP